MYVFVFATEIILLLISSFFLAVAAKYYRLIGKWLDDGSFKANNVKILPDGLASVDKGIDMLFKRGVFEKLLKIQRSSLPSTSRTIPLPRPCSPLLQDLPIRFLQQS